MKKISYYIVVVVLTCLAACQGKEWDTEEELSKITESWAHSYVNYTLDQLVKKSIDGSVIIATSVNDTLYREFHHLSSFEKGDSVNVISTLTQIDDSTIVTVEGYRYSKNYYAHLYTLDPGIINYEGKFHIDFYETGKSTPWAWSEITYKSSLDVFYFNHDSGLLKVGHY
ncbi:MAG: hypothetical protein J6Y78_07140 [Paludibacteraceae bacterium]|nr:hypothetical protein [Paludibacteraceae bacterium]